MVSCTGCAGRGHVELAQPVQDTIRGNTQSCSPEDGHSDAPNVLRWTVEINLRLVGFSLYLKFFHSHTSAENYCVYLHVGHAHIFSENCDESNFVQKHNISGNS